MRLCSNTPVEYAVTTWAAITVHLTITKLMSAMSNLKLAIADPPYLGRANRWYGDGCGDGYGLGRADSHPEAKKWDDPKAHIELVHDLNNNFDSWAIAMTVHSLSTYLSVIDTDSRNGIRVMSWIKPAAVTSGSRVTNSWEPVIVKIAKERRGWNSGVHIKDYLSAAPMRSGFIGAKPEAWTHWVLDAMGYTEGDELTDIFAGSGAVTHALNSYRSRLPL
jgi:hypothetical protein